MDEEEAKSRLVSRSNKSAPALVLLLLLSSFEEKLAALHAQLKQVEEGRTQITL